jgi:hypothetical protein
MLLQWGIHRGRSEHVPVYLESTVEAAALYERNHFQSEASFSMVLEGMGKDGGPVTYSETCFVLRPNGSGEDNKTNSETGAR